MPRSRPSQPAVRPRSIADLPAKTASFCEAALLPIDLDASSSTKSPIQHAGPARCLSKRSATRASALRHRFMTRIRFRACPSREIAKVWPASRCSTSPPFSENARLILKVSHNLHASTLPLLLAVRHGKRQLEDGLRLEHDFLKRAGLDADSISFGGGAGGSPADFTTPRVNVALLRSMSTRPDFAVYERALPILGVDGTLWNDVATTSPARGKVRAKTGTLVWQNGMNKRFLVTSKALAGYLTAKSGRELVFSFVVNGVQIDKATDTKTIGKVLGHLCEIVYEAR